MKTYTSIDQINDLTCFTNGDLFRTPGEVRSYFTAENLRFMGWMEYAIPSDDDLTAMADTVIEQRWHCAF